MSRYVAAISALPRSVKWALGALVAIGLYFAVVERTIDAINTVSSRADLAETTLNKFAASNEPQKRSLDTLRIGFRTFGDVEFPAEQSARAGAFNSAVDKILKEQKVSAKSRTKNAPLGAG